MFVIDDQNSLASLELLVLEDTQALVRVDKRWTSSLKFPTVWMTIVLYVAVHITNHWSYKHQGLPIIRWQVWIQSKLKPLRVNPSLLLNFRIKKNLYFFLKNLWLLFEVLGGVSKYLAQRLHLEVFILPNSHHWMSSWLEGICLHFSIFNLLHDIIIYLLNFWIFWTFEGHQSELWVELFNWIQYPLNGLSVYGDLV
jgi:hypothetical protein